MKEMISSSMQKMFKRGDCPDVQFFKKVDLTRLSGDWYAHRMIEAHSAALTCYHTNYQSNADKTFIVR